MKVVFEIGQEFGPVCQNCSLLVQRCFFHANHFLWKKKSKKSGTLSKVFYIKAKNSRFCFQNHCFGFQRKMFRETTFFEVPKIILGFYYKLASFRKFWRNISCRFQGIILGLQWTFWLKVVSFRKKLSFCKGIFRNWSKTILRFVETELNLFRWTFPGETNFRTKIEIFCADFQQNVSDCGKNFPAINSKR